MNGPKKHRTVSIEQSARYDMHSEFTGRDYTVKVWWSGSGIDPDKTYDVLYLLDGDHLFGLATDTVQYLLYTKKLPNFVIISPSYGSKISPDFGGKNCRNVDFIPYKLIEGSEPGGLRYYEFLTKELQPEMEKKLRLDTGQRLLFGYSYGAIMALYTLTRPDHPFQSIIALDWCNEKLLEILQHNRDLVSLNTLFLGSGFNDMFPIYAILKPSGIHKIEYAKLSSREHFAAPGEGLARGLMSIYDF